jgi:radical SAM superfamily enzyme YgiQ (UPF0313 family)
MKILLVGINARNIHANPALYSLYQTAKARGLAECLSLSEYALHTPTQYIMAEIFNHQPDILAFSLYIWNVPLISALIRDMKKLLPELKIILGGPEASARAEHYLQTLPVEAICIGEGEHSFCAFIAAMLEAEQRGDSSPLSFVPGFLLKDAPQLFQPADTVDLSSLPFLYSGEIARLMQQGRRCLVYYESSRGCPYACSFCASARERLRERPLSMVMEELPQLAAINGQIKFIDRTFNANPQRARQISQKMLELYRPGLSWHLEVSPYKLSTDLAELWINAPEDYFQLEIGVQSLNPQALAKVNREGNWEAAEPMVKRLIAGQGCHVHLDLIAGLPADTPEGFAASFHRLHQLNADYLQFGFLKLLPGSVLQEKAEEYGLVYSGEPPYQILATPEMNPAYLFDLHRAERAFNALYNKTKDFRDILIALAEQNGDALSLYLRAAEIMPVRGLNPREAERIVQQLQAKIFDEGR